MQRTVVHVTPEPADEQRGAMVDAKAATAKMEARVTVVCARMEIAKVEPAKMVDVGEVASVQTDA